MAGMTLAAHQALSGLVAANNNLLAANGDGPTVNSNGIVEWAVKSIIPIVLLVIGIGIIASARRGRISDNANTITNVVLGMGVIAGAGVLYIFAGDLTNLVFGT